MAPPSSGETRETGDTRKQYSRRRRFSALALTQREPSWRDASEPLPEAWPLPRPLRPALRHATTLDPCLLDDGSLGVSHRDHPLHLAERRQVVDAQRGETHERISIQNAEFHPNDPICIDDVNPWVEDPTVSEDTEREEPDQEESGIRAKKKVDTLHKAKKMEKTRKIR